MSSKKVLFIASSISRLGETNEKIGVWLEEIAAPYYVFKEAGMDVILASPDGGRVPIDPKSQAIILATFNTKRFLKDVDAMGFIAGSMLLKDVKPADFDLVFIPSGYSLIWDLAENKLLNRLLEAFNARNIPIGVASHGAACLLSMKNNDGDLFISGKRVTCFSNSEELLSGLEDKLPFLLQTRISSLGAIYSKQEDFVSHVVEEGNFVFGQNPASSKGIAQKMLALAQHNQFISRVVPATN